MKAIAFLVEKLGDGIACIGGWAPPIARRCYRLADRLRGEGR